MRTTETLTPAQRDILLAVLAAVLATTSLLVSSLLRLLRPS